MAASACAPGMCAGVRGAGDEMCRVDSLALVERIRGWRLDARSRQGRDRGRGRGRAGKTRVQPCPRNRATSMGVDMCARALERGGEVGRDPRKSLFMFMPHPK